MAQETIDAIREAEQQAAVAEEEAARTAKQIVEEATLAGLRNRLWRKLWGNAVSSWKKRRLLKRKKPHGLKKKYQAKEHAPFRLFWSSCYKRPHI